MNDSLTHQDESGLVPEGELLSAFFFFFVCVED